MEKPRSFAVEKRNDNTSLPRSPPVTHTRQINGVTRNPSRCQHTSLESLVFTFDILPCGSRCGNKLNHDIFSQSFVRVIYDLAGIITTEQAERKTEEHITIAEQVSLSSLNSNFSGGDRPHVTLIRCWATSYANLRGADSECWKRC